MKSKFLQIPVLERYNNIADSDTQATKEIRFMIPPAAITAGLSILAALVPRLLSKDKIAEGEKLIASNETKLKEIAKNITLKDVYTDTLYDFDISEAFDTSEVEVSNFRVPVAQLEDSEFLAVNDDLGTSLAAQLPLIGGPISLVTSFGELAVKSLKKLFGRKKNKNKKAKMKKLIMERERMKQQGEIVPSKEIEQLEHEVENDDDGLTSSGNITFSSDFDFDANDYEYIGDICLPVQQDWWSWGKSAKELPTLEDFTHFLEAPYNIPANMITTILSDSAKDEIPKDFSIRYYYTMVKVLTLILSHVVEKTKIPQQNVQVNYNKEKPGEKVSTYVEPIMPGGTLLKEKGIYYDVENIDDSVTSDVSKNLGILNDSVNKALLGTRRSQNFITTILPLLKQIASATNDSNVITAFNATLPVLSHTVDEQNRQSVLLPVGAATAQKTNTAVTRRQSKYRASRII